MAIDNSVYYQNGTRFGPEWEQLEVGEKFDASSHVFLKHNNDGTAEVTGILVAKDLWNFISNVDVVIKAPEGFKFEYMESDGDNKHWYYRNQIWVSSDNGKVAEIRFNASSDGEWLVINYSDCTFNGRSSSPVAAFKSSTHMWWYGGIDVTTAGLDLTLRTVKLRRA